MHLAYLPALVTAGAAAAYAALDIMYIHAQEQQLLRNVFKWSTF